MVLFKAEILGKVPNGLTHNDVHATILSVVNDESPRVQTVNKRRLSGNMVSVVCVFEAENMTEAMRIMRYAASSVTGFSADVVGPFWIR
jgi:hypothetical protein